MGTFDSVYLNKIRFLEEENKKLKSILRRALNEETDTHQKIKDFLAATLANQYPHKYENKDSSIRSPAVSAAHIHSILDATGPHTSAQSAIAAIRPHAIDGNYSLEERIYERRPESYLGTDISELDNYEELVQENEETYADRLEGDLHHHLTSGGGSEDGRIPRSM